MMITLDADGLYRLVRDLEGASVTGFEWLRIRTGFGGTFKVKLTSGQVRSLKKNIKLKSVEEKYGLKKSL